jgi:hypothetical protein
VAADAARVCATAPPAGAIEVYAASALLDGRSVELDVFSVENGSLLLVVTDAASCTELFSQKL